MLQQFCLHSSICLVLSFQGVSDCLALDQVEYNDALLRGKEQCINTEGALGRSEHRICNIEHTVQSVNAGKGRCQPIRRNWMQRAAAYYFEHWMTLQGLWPAIRRSLTGVRAAYGT
jgi:hypothetical protein